MKCPACGSHRMELVAAIKGDSSEPGHDAFYECMICCAVVEDDYDAGSEGDYRFEIMREERLNLTGE